MLTSDYGIFCSYILYLGPLDLGTRMILSRPVGLDFHTEAGFDFSKFFPLLNPSGFFRDVIIWFYSIYCMFI